MTQADSSDDADAKLTKLFRMKISKEINLKLMPFNCRKKTRRSEEKKMKLLVPKFMGRTFSFQMNTFFFSHGPTNGVRISDTIRAEGKKTFSLSSVEEMDQILISSVVTRKWFCCACWKCFKLP